MIFPRAASWMRPTGASTNCAKKSRRSKKPSRRERPHPTLPPLRFDPGVVTGIGGGSRRAARARSGGDMPFPIQLRPSKVAQEIAELTYKATKNLSRLNEDQIKIGTTPKEPVYAEDNIVLYHYTPVVERPFPIPILISYALVNRPYMVD